MNEPIPPGPPAGADPDEAWALVRSSLRFVGWLVRDFLYTGLPREDLEAEGTLGLFDAAQRFDRSRGVQFATYASWAVRRRIQTFVLRYGRIVRRPESRGVASLRAPNDVSLDDPLGRDPGHAWKDVLADERSVEPLRALLRDEDVEFVAAATTSLPETWRFVIVERYGLGGGPPHTLAWIGDRLDVSRERVRQIEMKALARLRGRADRAWRCPAAEDPGTG
jgi:RNA polymerase sigma factor (sigma-70 family)